MNATEAEIIPLTTMRRRIGQHMRASRDTAAHTLMAIEVDYGRVAAARRLAREGGLSLSYLPFIARAVNSGIEEFPHVNAWLVEDSLHVHPRLNLGIAVDLDFKGLIVPVLKDAGTMPLEALAAGIEDLATRARTRKLKPDDVAGGSFTITNAGGYGTLFTGAIINLPQVAILSTDGIQPKPVAVPCAPGEGSDEYRVEVRPIGVLALTWDHRAFDGAYAAAFLRHLKNELEEREWSADLPQENSR